MESKAKKQQKVYIAATVFALHLGKMTAIMSSVLTTLVTDISIVNRVKSDTDGVLVVHRPRVLCYWWLSSPNFLWPLGIQEIDWSPCLLITPQCILWHASLERSPENTSRIATPTSKEGSLTSNQILAPLYQFKCIMVFLWPFFCLLTLQVHSKSTPSPFGGFLESSVRFQCKDNKQTNL